MKQMATRPRITYREAGFYIESLPDERLDTTWGERRNIVLGTLAVVLFVVLVTLLAGGS
jgi:preprotein translocase subunit SecE